MMRRPTNPAKQALVILMNLFTMLFLVPTWAQSAPGNSNLSAQEITEIDSSEADISPLEVEYYSDIHNTLHRLSQPILSEGQPRFYHLGEDFELPADWRE